jgi:ribonuclease P protein component
VTNLAPIPLDRLRSSQDIQAVFRGPDKRAGRFLVVHARHRSDDAASRVAVIASRRVGTAVARNRAKRLLREAARQQAWRSGLDVVLIARGPAASASLAEVMSDLAAAAGHLDLLDAA